MKQPKRYTKSTLPSKPCAHCGRPFNWRKKWADCWDEARKVRISPVGTLAFSNAHN
ncbi:MAG: DUF2256 domain-containing protein [Pontibacterium sp.]